MAALSRSLLLRDGLASDRLIGFSSRHVDSPTHQQHDGTALDPQGHLVHDPGTRAGPLAGSGRDVD